MVNWLIKYKKIVLIIMIVFLFMCIPFLGKKSINNISANDVEVDHSQSQLADFKIKNDKVYFYCLLTIINHSQYEKEVTFTAESKEDVKGGLLQNAQLDGVEWKDGFAISDNNSFLLQGNSITNDLQVVFVGKHNYSNQKYDRNIPNTISIHEKTLEQ